MNTDVVIVAIVIGGPILVWLLRETYGIGLKLAEIKLKEKQVQAEERRREDEMNARILRMDDYGISPAEINQLAEEVRQLREEVRQIKQNVDSRLG